MSIPSKPSREAGERKRLDLRPRLVPPDPAHNRYGWGPVWKEVTDDTDGSFAGSPRAP